MAQTVAEPATRAIPSQDKPHFNAKSFSVVVGADVGPVVAGVSVTGTVVATTLLTAPSNVASRFTDATTAVFTA